mmetsp:Transcript_2881/g.6859  ORF Transcript_2881/g.6859 Transcript_2881/m.6859 type:complete len:97 (+) Transcript_2881:1461-1751(+)
MVIPSVVKFFKQPTIPSDVVASRPEVGSSRKRTIGHAANSRPILTRFLWPPEMPRFSTLPTMLCWIHTSCMAWSTSSTIRLRRVSDVRAGFLSFAE